MLILETIGWVILAAAMCYSMWRFKDMKFNSGIQFSIIVCTLGTILWNDKDFHPLIHMSRLQAIILLTITLMVQIWYLELECRKRSL